MEVPSLQTRSFGNNQIEDLSADVILQCSKSLSSWEGPNNQLQTVPSLFGCTRFTTVDLGDNALREAPAISPSVIRINLNNNAISSISGIFSGAQLGSGTFRSDLAELSLRGNKLRNLEEDIARCLTNVTLLDVGQNDLTDLPQFLGYLPQLRRVLLDDSHIRTIRTSLLTDTATLKVRQRTSPSRTWIFGGS